jgi:hypothetical protein
MLVDHVEKLYREQKMRQNGEDPNSLVNGGTIYVDGDLGHYMFCE